MITKIIIGTISLIHLVALKMLNWSGITFSCFSEISMSSKICVRKGGKLYLNKSVHLFRNTYIKVNKDAQITIGQHTSLNNGTTVVSRTRIKIGDNCSVGPNVMIYDHDHVFGRNTSIKDDEYKCSEVEIGDNVWIGAGAIILRGSHIGNNSVIGAGTVVKGDIPSGSLVYQQRETVIKELL